MSQGKALKIAAWAFTAAAIAAMIHTAVSHGGGGFAAVLITFALLLQYSYGRDMKKKK